jgi:hypothetical protein
VAYARTTWVDGTTPVDAAHLNNIEAGLVAVDARPAIPAVVNGQWLKGVGGAVVWSAIAAGDLPDLSGTYQAKTEKGAASGYASLDGATKVPTAQIPDLSATYQVRSERAAANGYASLDGTGKVPTAQLPAIGGGVTAAALVYRGTAFSLPEGTTIVTWDTLNQQVGAMWSSSTNPGRLTCPASLGGWYLFGANLVLSATNYMLSPFIRLNGTTQIATGFTANFAPGAGQNTWDGSIAGAYPLSPGDYIELLFSVPGGSGAKTLAASQGSNFWAVRVG